MVKLNQRPEFWIVNISNKNVSLSDLALTIPAYKNMNLLDSKHFNYTLKTLEASAKSGSLFKKQNLVKVRQVAPVELPKTLLTVYKYPRYVASRSAVVVTEPKYEELNFSDEKFAEDFIDLTPTPINKK